MPNYSLVIDSTFKPFTYDELIAPVKRMSDVHDQIASQYDELSSKTDILELLAGRDKTSNAYRQYQKYSNQLAQEADALMREGLVGASKARIMGMRRAYNKNIVPIQTAWNKREEEAAAQQKLAAANPSIMFTRVAADTGIDDYIANPMGGYGTIDGNQITKQVGDMAAQLAEQVNSGRISIDNIDPYTQRIIQGHGMSAAEISYWMQNPNSFPTLTNMVTQVLTANGVSPEALQGVKNAPQIIQRSANYAMQGIWKSLGKDSVSFQKDTAAVAALDDYYKQQEEKRKAEAEAAKLAGTAGGELAPFDSYYSEIPMYGADDTDAGKQKDAMKVLGYRDNVMKDGLEFDGKITLNYDLTKDELNAENSAMWDDIHRLQEKEANGTITPEEKAELRTKSFKASRAYKRSGVSKEYSIYDSNGKIMTRDKFVAQAGKSENAKKALNDYYDKILEAEKSLGISGTSYTHDQLDSYYGRLRDSQAAQFIYGTDLGIQPGDWNSSSRGLRAKKVKSYRGGKPQYESEDVSLGEILKNSEKEGNDVAAYWVRDRQQTGIIITVTEGGKPQRYFIPKDRIPGEIVRRGDTFMAEADNVYGKDPERYQSARLSGINNIVTGLTGRYDKVSEDVRRQYGIKDIYPTK